PDAPSADDAALATLRRFASAPGVVALGETGLDYYYEHSPRAAQRAAFARTAAMARELDLPLVVHVRDAHREAAEVLRSEPLGPAGGVIHCFSGGTDDARGDPGLRLPISLSRLLTFPHPAALPPAGPSIPPGRPAPPARR